MVFAPFSGRLNVKTTLAPIGLDGDPFTSGWAGNALLRNGWQPSPGIPRPHIHCIHKHQMVLTLPDGRQKTTASIKELLAEMNENNMISGDDKVRCEE